MRLGLLFFSTAVVLGLLEIVFRFLPMSHSMGYALAAQLWDRRYWGPVNRFGFRDEEIPESLESHRPIFVVGDSFAAGAGIRRRKDRFGDRLHARVSPERRVVCLAKPGWGTLTQAAFLKHFPHKPQTLVLAYVLNDIEERAGQEGVSFYGYHAYNGLSGWARAWVTNSYLVNAIYWLFPNADMDQYVSYLKRCYSDARVLSAHLEDLRYFVEYARENRARLLVVVFPFFTIKESDALLEPVIRFFEDQGVDVISVPKMVRGVPPQRLIVNKMDTHPNETVHRQVADQLWRHLNLETEK